MKYYILRKKHIILFFLLAAISVIIFSFFIMKIENKKQAIKIERENSWFDEFYVEENKVYMKCYITIRNSSDENNYIKLVAGLEEDVKNMLIKNPKVIGQDSKGSDMFFVPANSKKEYTVFFIDDYAGENKKQDRNLPEIEVEVQ